MKIVSLIALLFNFCFPCSIVYKPINKFNPNEAIFTGKVLKYIYTTKYFFFKGKSIPHKYWGILVEVNEKMYIPGVVSDFYEIYPFGLGPDCRLTNFGEYNLKELYPLNSIIRIVATPPEVLKEISSESPILEVSPFNNFRISVNIDSVSFLKSTKYSVYDYPKGDYKDLNNFADRMADSLNIDKQNRVIFKKSIYNLQDFELRKDFWRLHSIENETLKIPIIDRLKNFKYFSNVTLIKIINENIDNQKIRKHLIDREYN